MSSMVGPDTPGTVHGFSSRPPMVLPLSAMHVFDFENLAIAHLLATGFMAGLIWTIHAVHYPLFAHVPEPYAPFQKEHMRRISLLLAVPWAVEILTAFGLFLTAETTEQRTWAFIGGVLIVLILGVTGLFAAPAHGKLLSQFDVDKHRHLMRVDLLRTMLWTVRSVVAVVLIVLAA